MKPELISPINIQQIENPDTSKPREATELQTLLEADDDALF